MIIFIHKLKSQPVHFLETITVKTLDNVKPSTATVTVGSITQTGATLTGKGADANSGVAKYRFRVYSGSTVVADSKEISSTAASYSWTTSILKAGTTYQAMVTVYDAAGNYLDSNKVSFTTQSSGVTPSSVAKVGDFVNYSVTVNGTTYNKWRILHFDTNGHMEIMCYNGPAYQLVGKSGIANCIQLLNSASSSYKNGTYGYSARHFGSNPTTPTTYQTVSTSYYVFKTSIPSDQSASLNQSHHTTDVAALDKFSSTKFAGQNCITVTADGTTETTNKSVLVASRYFSAGDASSCVQSNTASVGIYFLTAGSINRGNVTVNYSARS